MFIFVNYQKSKTRSLQKVFHVALWVVFRCIFFIVIFRGVCVNLRCLSGCYEAVETLFSNIKFCGGTEVRATEPSRSFMWKLGRYSLKTPDLLAGMWAHRARASSRLSSLSLVWVWPGGQVWTHAAFPHAGLSLEALVSVSAAVHAVIPPENYSLLKALITN